ncbi:LytR C-terminal domain-containing protein, partial [Staphylococcus aureus]
SRTLREHGYTPGEVRDRMRGEPTVTAIDYGTGAATDASDIAALLGIDASDHPDSALRPNRIRVVVGDDYTPPLSSSLNETTTTSTVSGSYHKSGTATATEPTRHLRNSYAVFCA